MLHTIYISYHTYIDVDIVNIMHIYIYNSSQIRKLKSIQFNVRGTGGQKVKRRKNAACTAFACFDSL